MANGDLQWSGRAVRWLVWRLPKSAARYTWDSNMALATDLGRRWATLAVYGAFLWGLRWVANNFIPPLRPWAAILVLLWFYWAVSLVRWSWNARPGASRNRQAMREMYQTVHELRTDVREAISTAAQRAGGGTFTMMGSMRHHDPVADEHRRTSAEQQQWIRKRLPEEHQDMPLGDQFEPIVKLPRWMRRRKPQDDSEGGDQ